MDGRYPDGRYVRKDLFESRGNHVLCLHRLRGFRRDERFHGTVIVPELWQYSELSI